MNDGGTLGWLTREKREIKESDGIKKHGACSKNEDVCRVSDAIVSVNKMIKLCLI